MSQVTSARRAVDIIGKARFGDHAADVLDDPREPHSARASLGVVARLEPLDAAGGARHRDRPVLGHRPVDGPLPRDDLAPSARSPGHGHEAQPGVLQVPERTVRFPREDSVREERVVEIEEDTA